MSDKIKLYCVSCNDAVDIDEADLEYEVRKFKKIHPTCSNLEAFLNNRSIGLICKENIKTFDRLLN